MKLKVDPLQSTYASAPMFLADHYVLPSQRSMVTDILSTAKMACSLTLLQQVKQLLQAMCTLMNRNFGRSAKEEVKSSRETSA